MTDRPRLYFRYRGDTAAVFEIVEDLRNRRVEFKPLASVNSAGDVAAHGRRALTPEDREAITAEFAPPKGDDPASAAIRAIGEAAHWLQTAATGDVITEAAPQLLHAMHDLRGVLIRQQSKR